MFLLDSHELINSIVNRFLDSGSRIDLFERNDLVNLFVHTVCTVITISHCISDHFVVFVKEDKINAPGIHAHAYRDLADLFAFLKTRDDLPEDAVKFPAELAVLLNHTVLKTMYFFEFDPAVLHVSEDQASAGSAHIYCQIICSHIVKTS